MNADDRPGPPAEPEPGPGLVLVGYRGTGKTTVGRIVAAQAGRRFVDSDHWVEARAGQPIRRIFEAEGEPGFRDRESDALAEIARDHPGAVVATGGGAILRPENRDRLRRFGLVVWLTADPETLARRIRAGRHAVADRPALTAAGTLGEIADVLAARTPLYRDAAHVAVETARQSLDHVAAAVLDAWAGARAGGPAR